MNRRLILPAALAGVMLLAACGTGEEAATPPASAPAGATATVRDTTLAALLEAAGTAEPLLQATLSTRLMATVASVTVREGERVGSGQVLVRLDTRDLDAKAAQVEAGLAEAEAMHREAEAMERRIRSLYNDSAATRVQLEQAETGLARTQAAVRTARAAAAEVAAHRSYAEISAPFAGVVVSRFVDPGAMAAPGAPLVLVEDASRLRVRVTAAPDHVRGLTRGAVVEVLVEGKPVRGEVEGVVRALTGNMAQVNVIVPNRDGALVSGSAATVLLPHGTRAALMVPVGAVIREGDLTGVDLVVAGAVERRWIRLGRILGGGLVEVLSGLAQGDQVMLRGAMPGGA